MKVAVIVDIHGNYHGLEAIVHDVEHERAELLVCAGGISTCTELSAHCATKARRHEEGLLRTCLRGV